MLTVLTVIGTRPEAIKVAPIIRELQRHPESVLSRVCVTAQHRQMLDQALSLFQIEPDYDLNLMRQDQSPSQVAATIIARLEPIFQRERPDWVLVQGDTTTAMAAALCAFYCRVPVGHVEAGLRTGDKTQPFPEEVHRRIAGVVADRHFVPTQQARENLLRERIPDEWITLTGNPVIDALHMASGLPYPLEYGPLAAIPWNRRIILVTAHRRENFGAPLRQICAALREIAWRYAGDVQIVYPVHANPAIREPVCRLLGDIPGITLLPPLDYLPFVQLLKRCYLVLTDSGGVQEEAPSLAKPVLVLRNTTERTEAIAAGTVQLVGTNTQSIVEETTWLLNSDERYQCMARAVNPYGDGRAAQRIVAVLLCGTSTDKCSYL